MLIFPRVCFDYFLCRAPRELSHRVMICGLSISVLAKTQRNGSRMPLVIKAYRGSGKTKVEYNRDSQHAMNESRVKSRVEES